MPFMVTVEVRKVGSIGEFTKMTIGSTTDETAAVEKRIIEVCKQSGYESRGYRIMKK